jgi:ElaA protein
MNLVWEWLHFEKLPAQTLYELLSLRQRVFVLEQRCFYLDADGLDQKAWHLLGWVKESSGRPSLVAYLRVLPPGARYAEHSIGRVLTSPEIRGRGCGRLVMQEGLARIAQEFGAVPVRISAQAHLEKFYGELGFKPVGIPYDEDGIPHLEMMIKAVCPVPDLEAAEPNPA